MAPEGTEFIKQSGRRGTNMLVTLKMSLNFSLSHIFFPFEEIEHMLFVIKPSIIGETAVLRTK